MFKVEKVSEGCEKREDELPIDVNYNKLVDWLIDRKKLGKHWQRSIEGIRQKIDVALKQMPEIKEIQDMLKGNYVTYFHCVTIRDLMSQDESTNKKNLFGGYTGKHMKEWNDIIRSYEKDNVFLGECGQILAQNVNYEVPAVKKLVQRAQQQLVDLDRREGDMARTSAEFREKFNNQCRSLGIKGENIQCEVETLTSELPAVYKDVVSQAEEADVVKAIEFYEAFVGFLLDKKEPITDRLQFLKCVIAKGNPLISELSGHSAAPVNDNSGAEVDIDWGGDDAGAEIDFGDGAGAEIDFGDDSGAAGEIDFGDDGGADAGEIDFDISADAGAGEIDFDISGADAGEIDFDTSADAGAAEIDFDISGADGADAGISYDISAEPTADEGGDTNMITEALKGLKTGKGETLFDNSKLRNLFINDILELQAFLNQRIADAENPESLAMNQFQYAPSLVQEQDSKSTETLLRSVTKLLALITSPRCQQLIMVKTSTRYVDRLVSSLTEKLNNAQKLTSTAESVKTKREELTANITITTPAHAKLVGQTKTLQEQVQGAISKMYSNRTVHLIGEINKI